MRVNCRPSRKTRLLKILDAQYPKTSLFRRFSRKNTLRARGESNRVPPGSDPPTSRRPNHYANPAWNPGFSAASYAQEMQALGEQCASIVVHPEKHDLKQLSTPNILKRHCFVIFRGKTHSAGAFLNVKITFLSSNVPAGAFLNLKIAFLSSKIGRAHV